MITYLHLVHKIVTQEVRLQMNYKRLISQNGPRNFNQILVIYTNLLTQINVPIGKYQNEYTIGLFLYFKITPVV